jgi:hypothetical protein
LSSCVTTLACTHVKQHHRHHAKRQGRARGQTHAGSLSELQVSSPPLFSTLTNATADDRPRRKKTRCPGGRPACEYCLRLGQICEYASDSMTSTNVNRVRRASSISMATAANNAPMFPPASITAALEQSRGPSVPTTVRASYVWFL